MGEPVLFKACPKRRAVKRDPPQPGGLRLLPGSAFPCRTLAMAPTLIVGSWDGCPMPPAAGVHPPAGIR